MKMSDRVFEHYRMACADNRQICCADLMAAYDDEAGVEFTHTGLDRWEKKNRDLICYRCSKAPDQE